MDLLERARRKFGDFVLGYDWDADLSEEAQAEIDEAFRQFYLKDTGKCIPSMYVGDDLLLDIATKFKSIYTAVTDEVAERLGLSPYQFTTMARGTRSG